MCFPAVPAVLEPRGGARELIDPQHAPAPKATEAPEPARFVEQNDVQRGTTHLDSGWRFERVIFGAPMI